MRVDLQSKTRKAAFGSLTRLGYCVWKCVKKVQWELSYKGSQQTHLCPSPTGSVNTHVNTSSLRMHNKRAKDVSIQEVFENSERATNNNITELIRSRYSSVYRKYQSPISIQNNMFEPVWPLWTLVMFKPVKQLA